MERVIAVEIGLVPHRVWPERYTEGIGKE